MRLSDRAVRSWLPGPLYRVGELAPLQNPSLTPTGRCPEVELKHHWTWSQPRRKKSGRNGIQEGDLATN